jgi:hypothetical protein
LWRGELAYESYMILMLSRTDPLINTLLQRGVRCSGESFNSFGAEQWETVETVYRKAARFHTPLKQGVNEKLPTCQPQWN